MNLSTRASGVGVHRVMQVLVSLEKHYGGPPVSTVYLSSAISDLSVSIRVCATRRHNSELSDCVKSPALETFCFPRSRVHGWYHSPEFGRHIEKNVKEYDLVHIQEVWSYPQLVAGTIASVKSVPYLITPRGELDHRHLRHGGLLKRLKKRLYLKAIGRKLLRNAACLHAINTSEAEELVQAKFCKAVTVIPNGVNLAEFEDLPSPDAAEERWPFLQGKRVVLFLSRLSPEKGLDQLLPAWEELHARESFADAVLVVAGPDSRGYEQTVQGIVRERQLEGSVFFTGMVTGAEKLALMNRADIYVLPSYSEGFSMSVLENLAVGTPVLITPGCNFPEVVEAGAGVCVEPEAGEVTEGLRQLLDLSIGERETMGARGRDLVAKNYTWDVQARKMLNVYRCILDGKDVPMYPEPVKS